MCYIIKCWANLFRSPQAYRIFNTWMGDPGKLVLLEKVIKVIKQEKLLDLVCKTGEVLKSGLHELEKEFSTHIHSVRGRGTFLAYNSPTTELRDKIFTNMREKGNSTVLFDFSELYLNYLNFINKQITIEIIIFFYTHL